MFGKKFKHTKEEPLCMQSFKKKSEGVCLGGLITKYIVQSLAGNLLKRNTVINKLFIIRDFHIKY